ncbi:hypothetical protein ACMD2_16903 [Ananas comosus]|uniref:Uncharacterized protein n=1 Tax=Ananas comosus TaxID=4615 RepID=A0A199V4U7_ANACO|nr:hypothetical protein ACMD2_16903 [Ananas comosus]
MMNPYTNHSIDSCTLLPSSLASLGRTLCPELGPKGSIPHKDLVVFDLQFRDTGLENAALLQVMFSKTIALGDIAWTPALGTMPPDPYRSHDLEEGSGDSDEDVNEDVNLLGVGGVC